MYVHSAHHFAHIAKFEALAYISPGDSNDPTAPASESRTGSTPIRPFSFCQSSCSTSFTLYSKTITKMKSETKSKSKTTRTFPSPCESIHYNNTVSCLPKEAQLQVTKLHLEKSGTNRKVESWTQNLSVSKATAHWKPKLEFTRACNKEL